MKYLVIYNKVTATTGGGASAFNSGVYYKNTLTVLQPFDDLQEAAELALEKGGFVVKLVEVDLTEK